MEAVILSPGKELMSKIDLAHCVKVSNRCGAQINNPSATSQALWMPGHGSMPDQALALTEPFPDSHLLCPSAGEVSRSLRRGTRSPFSMHLTPSLGPATEKKINGCPVTF